jgi:hypothetical protein
MAVVIKVPLSAGLSLPETHVTIIIILTLLHVVLVFQKHVVVIPGSSLWKGKSGVKEQRLKTGLTSRISTLTP